MTATTGTSSNLKSQLRPEWTPLNIGIMVLAFISGIGWPLGLFMIAYMIWGRSWGLDFSTWGEPGGAAANVKSAFSSTFDGTAQSSRSSGNSAFDEWREAELARLNEERRKLDEAKREFQAYMDDLQKARDKEEFEKFRAQWNSKENGSSPE